MEVSFGETSALLCDDGRISVSAPDREPGRSERATTAEHEWSGVRGTLSSLGRAIAARSGEAPADVGRRLARALDAEAVDRLLCPRADGTDRIESRLLLSVDGYEVAMEPSGSIVVEPSLSVLKRFGAALLVVGSVPERTFDRLSSTLLGERPGTRPPIFALHGQDIETARRRLAMGGAQPGATVIRHRSSARAASTTPTEAEGPVHEGLDVVPVTGESRSLFEAVRDVTADTEFTAPGELRLCVDSLRSILSSTGLETTVDSIEPLRRTLRQNRGIGHFVLPGDADSETVETLAPAFDAVVEVRTGTDGPEQRWRLTGTGHETSWFALE